MPQKKSSFEDDLQLLEKVVADLSSGDLSLEKSMEQFEKGVKLYNECRKQLSTVEKKVSKLTDSLKVEVFSPENES